MFASLLIALMRIISPFFSPFMSPIVLCGMFFQQFKPDGLTNTEIKRKSGSFLKLEAKQLSAACHLGNFTLLSLLGVQEELEQIGN